MKRTPTPQQQACITSVLDTSSDQIKVEAVAGSGKTSTLVMMAEANPVPSLYLAFNKKTADEGTEKFPKYVKCQTTHSKAYAAYGSKIQHKLSRPKGRYVNVAGTGSEVARYFGIDTIHFDQDSHVGASMLGLLVKQTVARFEQSADAKIGKHHVPTLELKEKLHDSEANVAVAVTAVLRFAKKLWDERINTTSCVLATHDTYLKQFQLSKPVFGGVNVLYVDEFQDTTPCVLDIVKNQRGHMKIVMVGDARQAIYGWRGAVNAMQMVDCPTMPLTKSFRYGQAIADIATTVLERAMVITGNENIDSRVGAHGIVDKTKPYCRLFRTNAALLSAAVEEITKGTAVSIETDVKDFVKLLQSAVALYAGDMKNVKHENLIPYDNWEELLHEAKHDPELGRVAKLVKDGLAEKYCTVLEAHVNSPSPLVTFTTAHKSKGREFDQVVVENDFKSCYDEDGKWKGLTTEEQNLLYVALTRAINVLEYNLTTTEYMIREASHQR